MLYIVKAIPPATAQRASRWSNRTAFFVKSLSQGTRIIVVGTKLRKNTAGDLVSRAEPRAIPKIIAKSSLKVCAVNTAKYKLQIPKKLSIASTKAIRLKKTEKGDM